MSKKIDWYIVDKCSQPAKEAGSCYDYVLRYSYVSSSGDCEPFYYGGCEGNDNRFESADECEAECSGVVAATTRPPAQHTDRPPVDSRFDDSDSTGSLSYVSIIISCICSHAVNKKHVLCLLIDWILNFLRTDLTEENSVDIITIQTRFIFSLPIISSYQPLCGSGRAISWWHICLDDNF